MVSIGNVPEMPNTLLEESDKVFVIIRSFDIHKDLRQLFSLFISTGIVYTKVWYIFKDHRNSSFSNIYPDLVAYLVFESLIAINTADSLDQAYHSIPCFDYVTI